MSRRSDEDDADAWRIWLKITVEIERAERDGIARLQNSAWRVLAYLATRSDQLEPVDIDAIGETCSLSPASVSRALADLGAAGYLDTRPSSKGGRSVDRLVTMAGRHALGEIAKKHAASPAPNQSLTVRDHHRTKRGAK